MTTQVDRNEILRIYRATSHHDLAAIVFLPLLQELGYGDDPPTRALAQQLWDINQRADRTPEERRLNAWFDRTLARVRRQREGL